MARHARRTVSVPFRGFVLSNSGCVEVYRDVSLSVSVPFRGFVLSNDVSLSVIYEEISVSVPFRGFVLSNTKNRAPIRRA